MAFVSYLFWALTTIVVAVTAAPFSSSPRWWIRMWEFPRIHIAVAALGLSGAMILLPWAFPPALGIAALVCGIYQTYRIYPYTRLAQTEIEFSTNAPAESLVKVLVANVLMENTQHDKLIAIIEREDPDILFLMETDQVWLEALTPCLERYETRVSDPRDNHYGLIFATRLKAFTAEVVFRSDDATPSIKAELLSPDGKGFNFIGLHPRPPVPGNDTEQRDEQITSAADSADRADWQTVCAGDFNDVAWSRTSERFKRQGQYLEPRVGRGLHPTFHADYWFMRLPIDQIFLTKGVGLISFDRLEAFGSDHFPIKAVITFADNPRV